MAVVSPTHQLRISIRTVSEEASLYTMPRFIFDSLCIAPVVSFYLNAIPYLGDRRRQRQSAASSPPLAREG